MIYISLSVLIVLLLFISILPWFNQELFYQVIFGQSFFYWYSLISALTVIGLLIVLIRRNPFLMFSFCVIFLSWGLVWLSWQDTFPPEYMSLHGNRSDYMIEKGSGFYSLCYTPPNIERLCMAIGSSVFPLESYVGKTITFQAQLRHDWGKPMCYEETCPWQSKMAVVDMWDINLVTPSSGEK